jgi:hypothetical protein
MLGKPISCSTGYMHIWFKYIIVQKTMYTGFKRQWTNFQHSIVFCDKNIRNSENKSFVAYKERIGLHCMLVHHMAHGPNRIMDRAASGSRVTHVWSNETWLAMGAVQVTVNIAVICRQGAACNENAATQFYLPRCTKTWCILTEGKKACWESPCSVRRAG